MRRPVLASAAMAFAVAFNLPYAWLAARFSYPAILREPAGDVLTAFSAGGLQLVLAWYAFFWAALLFVPLAAALSINRERMTASPGMAIGAAVAGALSGAFQAVGLSRWVFVMPGLAASHAQGDPAAAILFDTLNAYGGVAVGEHLGQLLLALFVGLLGALQFKEGRRLIASGALLSSAAITLGTGEGLTLALGQSGEIFSLFTIAGFLSLSVWLLATGATMVSARPVSGAGGS